MVTGGDSERPRKRIRKLGSHVKREEDQAMRPKSILAGYYGSRGERLRYTVHEGALRLPSMALAMMEAQLDDNEASVRSKTYDLPSVEIAVRPTRDEMLLRRGIMVTELRMKSSPSKREGQMGTNTSHQQSSIAPRTTAINRRLKSSTKNAVPVLATDNDTDDDDDDDICRIRGGGRDGGGGGGDADGEEGRLDGSGSQPQRAQQSTDDDDASMMAARAESNHQHTAAMKSSSSSTTPEARMDQQQEQSTGSTRVPVIRPLHDAASEPSSIAAAKPPTAENATAKVVVVAVDPAEAPTPPTPGSSTTMTVQESDTSSSTRVSAPPSSAAASTPTASSAPPCLPHAPAAVDQASSTKATTSTSKTKRSPPAEGVLQPLSKRPPAQWQSLVPGPNDEMQVEITSTKPSWYVKDAVADIERAMLPEWFDDSAPHRTPLTYVEAREEIVKMSDKLGNRFVTPTLIRRTIAGDAGSLYRLHAFLVAYGLINVDALNDSMPTPPGLRYELNDQRHTQQHRAKRSVVWTQQLRDELMEAVVFEFNKRKDLASCSIDWHQVASRLGYGIHAIECEREFLALPLSQEEAQDAEREDHKEGGAMMSNAKATTDSQPSKPSDTDVAEWLLAGVSRNSRQNVMEAALRAAMENSVSVKSAQGIARCAIVAGEAVERASKEENHLMIALTELHDQRLQKLENRMALLDDVECLLETERATLEAERRDLFTARCRHWFGGGGN